MNRNRVAPAREKRISLRSRRSDPDRRQEHCLPRPGRAPASTARLLGAGHRTRLAKALNDHGMRAAPQTYRCGPRGHGTQLEAHRSEGGTGLRRDSGPQRPARSVRPWEAEPRTDSSCITFSSAVSSLAVVNSANTSRGRLIIHHI